MNSKKYEIKRLDWDSAFFKVSCGRVDIYKKLDQSDFMNMLADCKEYECLSINNHGNMIENNILIGKYTSAFLVDVNVQFLKEPLSGYPRIANIKIKNNFPYNDAILALTKTAYTESKFIKDENLNRRHGDEVYVNWIRNAFGLENKYFLVSQIQQDLMGYILFSIDGDKATIELIAVNQEKRGKGIARNMIHYLENNLRTRDIKIIGVGTQINNTPAIKLYESVGFKMDDCVSTFHRWR